MAQPFIFGQPQLVLCKAESSYGSDPTPAGSDALRCRSFSAKTVYSTEELKRHRATWASNKHAVKAISVDIEIELDVKGPDAVAGGQPIVVPEADALLEAAGYISTGSGSPVALFTYARSSSTAQKSVTLYHYEVSDGGTYQLRKYTGCVFNAKLSIPANGIAYWTLSGKGLWNGAAAAASPLPTPTYKHASDHVPGRGCTLVYGDCSDVITKVEIDLGAKVIERGSIAGTYGFAGFAIALGQPMIKIDPEALLESAYTLEADILAGALDNITITVPTVEGGEWVFSAPKAQPIKADAIDGDIKHHDLELACSDNSGDDSFSFTCARA
jgi:hypothetical protein